MRRHLLKVIILGDVYFIEDCLPLALLTDGWSVYPAFIPDGDQIVSKTHRADQMHGLKDVRV